MNEECVAIQLSKMADLGKTFPRAEHCPLVLRGMTSEDGKPDRGTTQRLEFVVPMGGNRVESIEPQDPGRNPLTRGNTLTKDSCKLVLRRTWSDFILDAIMDRAAVLAFFMFLTAAPTVLAAYSIATLIFARNERQVTNLTQEAIARYVPSEIADHVRAVVDVIVGSAAEGTWALVLAVLIALFSSSAWVRAFARSANFIYGRVEGRTVIPTWLTMWGITFLMVIGAVIIVGALLLRQSVVLAVFEPIADPLGLVEELDFLTGIFLPIWVWIRIPVIALIALTLVAVLYYFAPNVRPQHFRWLTVGSAVSVVTIGITWWLLGLYLQFFAGSSAYGAIGTIIAVIFACWIMNILLLIGIKLDAEVLRAKELQMGYDSERFIQAPPRSSTAAQKYAEVQTKLEESARVIKHRAGHGQK